MAEPIVIVLLTYRRTGYALSTITAAVNHLKYSGDLLWYVADDGSDFHHLDAVMSHLDRNHQHVIGMHSSRRSYGASANQAWAAASLVSPLSFWLEDDWVLKRDFDLYSSAALLLEREDIGMVRLGYLNAGIAGEIIAHNHQLYLSLDNEPIDQNQCVFTGHPSLRHSRFHDAYGDYVEGIAPGDTELAYAYRYRMGNLSMPVIVWPFHYPPEGLFNHIGTIKTENLDELHESDK